MKQATFSFSFVIDALKSGKCAARKGWNGKGMFLFLVRGETVTPTIHQRYNCQAEQPLEVLDTIYMKTADNKLVPWTASQTDILANDWEVGEATDITGEVV